MVKKIYSAPSYQFNFILKEPCAPFLLIIRLCYCVCTLLSVSFLIIMLGLCGGDDPISEDFI